MFKSFRNQGFQLTFDNGYTVSVQFGHYNYCDARNYNERYNDWRDHEAIHACQNAEVAIWYGDRGPFVDLDKTPSDVFGYQTPKDVAKIIATVASW